MVNTELMRPRAVILLSRALVAMAVALGTVVAILIPGHSARAATASPLLFGENLDLQPGSASTDFFLSNPALRAGLVNAGVHILRMPVRGSSPSTPGIANEPELNQALQLTKSLGLVPLVILRNPNDGASQGSAALLADDTRAVDDVLAVFGSTPVYYEFANETDLAGSGFASSSLYVSQWNAVVPHLKAIASPGSQFIGPVSYQYDPAYLQAFLTGANPQPDAISWHTYTCNDTNDSEATCLGNIDHWTTNFDAARTLMTNTIGRQLPIWDTEWNYTPVIDTKNSAKSTDTAFLKQWTTKAIQTLAADGIAASLHYNVQNSLPLVNGDGSFAAEGVAFNAEYTTLIGPGSPPSTSPSGSASSPTSPPSSPPSTSQSSPSSPPSTPTSSTPSAGGPRYSFEDGTLQGWTSTGGVSSLVNSTDVPAQDGTHELEAVFASATSSDQPYIHTNPLHGPTAGQTLSAYVYVPTTTTTTVTAKLYVQDSGYAWHQGAGVVISQRGAWVKLSLTPSGYSGSAIQVGLQFLESSPSGTPSTIFLDSVDWS
ncbi:MAG: hypothetical protein HOW97_38540 [Catenulispora sp.]|nr:hypothetical protein [Catenulispora sp.]